MTPADVVATMREALDALNDLSARQLAVRDVSGNNATVALAIRLRTAIAAVEALAQDAARLDWLDTTIAPVGSNDGPDTEHIANAWGVYGQRADVRLALDDAIADAQERAR